MSPKLANIAAEQGDAIDSRYHTRRRRYGGS